MGNDKNGDGVGDEGVIVVLEGRRESPLEDRIGIQRRRNCIYGRKFYDSIVDLLVNFGNFGSLDMS